MLRSTYVLILALLPIALTACRGDSTTEGGEDVGETAEGESADNSGSASESASESAESDSSDTASDTDTASDSSDTATDTTDTGDTTGDTDTGGPFCGDGMVDVGEECDDGIDNGPTGDCLIDCIFNVCGDGFEGPIEGCDDGNIINGDGCSAMCLIENLPPDVLPCGNKVYECGDTLDNDDDGLIDLADPECISPCDDDEGSFKTELPGQNNDCKQDCYFDANSGSGDDQCEWNLKCDPLNPGAQIGCEYDPDFMMCGLDMPQECLDFCVPMVPNGCDCFGCCEIEGNFYYLDGAECSLDNLAACEECTFFEGCNNPCVPEDCEVCFGQDPNDLPPECDEPSCPMGVTPCFDEADCQDGEFCQTGCCIAIQPQ